MKTLIQITLLFVLLSIVCCGCSVVKQPDGTHAIEFGISEETHQEVADTITGAQETVGGLSQIFPALLPIATALGVGGGVWRKMKKDVTKKQKPLEMLVAVLENLKQTDQETWDKVRAQIKQQYPPLELKATIEETLAELKTQGKLVADNVTAGAQA